MTSQEFEAKARELWEEVVRTSGVIVRDHAGAVDRLTMTTLAIAWGDRLLDQGRPHEQELRV